MSTVSSTDGTRIEYDRTGSGPTVILINAGPTDRKVHFELAAMLAGSNTVINYDRRGRGDSGDTAPYSVDREVEDLRAVAAAAGGEVGLFASSGAAYLAFRAVAGGLPVTRIAVWEPPCTVEGSRPPAPADYHDRLRRLADENRPGDMVELFLTQAVGLPAVVVAGLRQAPFWGSLEASANPGLVYDDELVGDGALPADDLARIHCPVLVLDGGTTPWVTVGADAIAKAAPNAIRETLPGQPHNVDTAVLAPALAAFFTA